MENKQLKALYLKTLQNIQSSPNQLKNFLEQNRQLFILPFEQLIQIHGQNSHASFLKTWEEWEKLGAVPRRGQIALQALREFNNPHSKRENYFDVTQLAHHELEFEDLMLGCEQMQSYLQLEGWVYDSSKLPSGNYEAYLFQLSKRTLANFEYLSENEKKLVPLIAQYNLAASFNLLDDEQFRVLHQRLFEALTNKGIRFNRVIKIGNNLSTSQYQSIKDSMEEISRLAEQQKEHSFEEELHELVSNGGIYSENISENFELNSLDDTEIAQLMTEVISQLKTSSQALAEMEENDSDYSFYESDYGQVIDNLDVLREEMLYRGAEVPARYLYLTIPYDEVPIQKEFREKLEQVTQGELTFKTLKLEEYTSPKIEKSISGEVEQTKIQSENLEVPAAVLSKSTTILISGEAQYRDAMIEAYKVLYESYMHQVELKAQGHNVSGGYDVYDLKTAKGSIQLGYHYLGRALGTDDDSKVVFTFSSGTEYFETQPMSTPIRSRAYAVFEQGLSTLHFEPETPENIETVEKTSNPEREETDKKPKLDRVEYLTVLRDRLIPEQQRGWFAIGSLPDVPDLSVTDVALAIYHENGTALPVVRMNLEGKMDFFNGLEYAEERTGISDFENKVTQAAFDLRDEFYTRNGLSVPIERSAAQNQSSMVERLKVDFQENVKPQNEREFSDEDKLLQEQFIADMETLGANVSYLKTASPENLIKEGRSWQTQKYLFEANLIRRGHTKTMWDEAIDDFKTKNQITIEAATELFNFNDFQQYKKQEGHPYLSEKSWVIPSEQASKDKDIFLEKLKTAYLGEISSFQFAQTNNSGRVFYFKERIQYYEFYANQLLQAENHSTSQSSYHFEWLSAADKVEIENIVNPAYENDGYLMLTFDQWKEEFEGQLKDKEIEEPLSELPIEELFQHIKEKMNLDDDYIISGEQLCKASFGGILNEVLVTYDGEDFEIADLADKISGVEHFEEKFDLALQTVKQELLPEQEGSVIVEAQEENRESEQSSANEVPNNEYEEFSLFDFDNGDVSKDTETPETPSFDSTDDLTVQEVKAVEKPQNKQEIMLPSQDFIFPDNLDNFYPKTPTEKVEANIQAIQLVKQLEQEGRAATADEQSRLAKYVGWGGLADEFFDENRTKFVKQRTLLKTTVTPNEYRAMRESSLTAYYTDPALIREMFIQLERQGFKGGRILDPAMGTGNFFSSLPAHLRQNSELYGIELDTITGSIAKFLHPNAHIKIQGFETIDFESESFDVIVGNVPFANFTITDAHYNKPYLIHDYFFKKSSELVRQGGLVSFITSTGTMNKPNASLRQELHQEMGLVSAVRLPNSAFKAIAGTKVATDILTLQKGQSDELDDWIETVPAEEAHDVDVNQFFSSSRSPYVLGEYEVQNHFRKTLTVVPEPTQPLLSSLHAAYEQQASFMPGVPAFFEGTQEERNNIIEKSILIKKDFSLSLPDEVKDLAPQTHKIVGDKVYFHDPDDGIIEKNQEWYDDGFQQAVDENDRLIFDQKGQPKLVNFRGKFDKKTLPRLKGMTAISEKVQAIIDYQLNQPPVQGEDSTFERLLSDLNRVYDNFIQDKNLALKGGNCLNSSKNAKLFADDINFYRLLSIENEVRDEDGHTTYEKGDFFFKKTITPSKGLPVIENAVDALNVSLNLYGQVNLDFMSEQLSVTSEEILSELQGQLFLNPISMQYEPASIYLSGNIKKKISQLRPFLNSNDSRFSSNQQALEAILPEPLSIHQIDFWIGTRWIPLSIYQTFLKEKLNNGYGLGMSLDYNTYRATYNIENATAINRVAEWQLSSLYRSLVISGKTANYNPIHLFENLLNLKNTKIKNTIKHEDGTTETFVDAELTIVAREKQILLQQAFKDFVHQTPEISQIMEQVYNDRFNSIVPRTYDGSHLTFSSLTDTITLRAHQKNAVARVIQEKRGLFAHVVGSGKTLSMIASGMKLKELGTINKPCYVVPKAVLNQFAADILRAYPDKNIIVPTYRDFEVSHRKRFVTKIQTGDYDAVILSNEQFGKIGLTKEREEAVIKAEIDEIVEARAAAKAKEGGRSTVKQLIQLEKSAKKRLLKLQTEKDDSPITFEATGIDFLFLDEAHHFKNLSYMTNITDVKGISTTASQRASSLLAKVRYLQEIHDGGGVVFATGTPVSNSMAELYTMMKYLMPRELRDYGISNFDEWASAFGEIETKNEVDQTGQKWKPVSRFSRFNNLPELMNLFSTVADIQTAEMLNLPTPEIANDGKPFVHASELTEAQAAFMKQLIWRSEHMPSDPSIDNFLKLTTEARLMATDMRLIDPDFYNPSDSLKGQQVAEEVHKIWEENKEKHSTQLIFSDIGTPKSERKDKNVSLNAEDLDYKFSVYADIRRRLMELGIPQKEIAFIHDYPTDKKKAELFEKVREGKIRVLFASTQKGGTGVNIQDRLIAVHHVDVPWRPSDIEQRNGRIVRQGNLNPEVQIHHYVTKGSFDTFMWQVQEKKLTYITQILSGKNVGRSMEDLDELVLTASEIKAIATNNPKIREKMDLENQLTSLSILRSTFYADKQADKREAERLEAHLPLMRQYATNALFDGKIAASYQTSSPEHFQLTLIDSTFTEKKKAGEFIASQAYHATEQKNLGQYAGFELLIKPNLAAELTAEPMAYLVGKNTYSTPVNLSSGIGTLTRLDNLVKNVIKGKADNQQEKIENIEKSIVTLKSKLNEPFEKEAEYQRLSQKLEAVNTAIELENVHKNTVEKEIKTPSQKIKTIDEEMEF